MGLGTLRTRFLKGGAEGPPRVIPVIPEPGADRVKPINYVIWALRFFWEFYIDWPIGMCAIGFLELTYSLAGAELVRTNTPRLVQFVSSRFSTRSELIKWDSFISKAIVNQSQLKYMQQFWLFWVYISKL